MQTNVAGSEDQAAILKVDRGFDTVAGDPERARNSLFGDFINEFAERMLA